MDIEIYYYEPFIVPFVIGVVLLFARIWTRFFSWISALPKSDKRKIFKNAVSKYTFMALWEGFSEILLHRRIYKINRRMWYIHFSLAFGWFLMIVVSKIAVALYLKNPINPPYVEIFFNRYFPFYDGKIYPFVMDFLLLFILSGIFMTLYKRRRPELFGETVKRERSWRDILVQRSIFAIFPLRLLAESFNSSIYDTGGFLTGSLGSVFSLIAPSGVLFVINDVLWWLYSIVSGVFLVMLPFSRYLHIFAEIPLIFLRNFGVKASLRPTTFSFLESGACSSCGLCLEVCPMVKGGVAGEGNPLHFIRSVRKRSRIVNVVDNCLMCGECEKICPVRIEHLEIRNGERYLMRHLDLRHKFTLDRFRLDSGGLNESVKVGYFAGCSTHLDIAIIESVKRIFNAANEEFCFLDQGGRLCCGENLLKAGHVGDSERLLSLVVEQIKASGVTLVVTSCYSCLNRFSSCESLSDIEFISVAEYVERQVASGALTISKNVEGLSLFLPCSVKSGGASVKCVAKEVGDSISNMLCVEEIVGDSCCGGSPHNYHLVAEQRREISLLHQKVVEKRLMVTLCARCKRTLKHSTGGKIVDFAEVVVSNLGKQG